MTIILNGTSGITFPDGTTQVDGLSTPVPVADGGTGNASLAVTAGGLIYTDGSKLVNTGVGTSGQILTSSGASAPTWAPGVDLQAFADGDAGQPKILGEAFAVIATYPTVTVSAASTYTLTNALGVTITSGVDQSQSSSYELNKQFVIDNYTGSIRVTSSLNGDSATVEFKVLKNGTQVYFASTSSDLNASVDISIVPTDIIRCEIRRDAGTGYANAFGTAVKANKRIVAASALKVEG